MHGDRLVTVQRIVCTEGEPPASRHAQTLQFPRLRMVAVGGVGGGAWAPSCPAAEPPPPPLPPSRLPPPSALPTPSRYAEQGKGHIDPLLKGSWSRTNLKSLQPQAGASWPIGPRDSGAGVELQSLGGTARQLVRVEIGEGLAWAPSFHSSVCLKLLEQLSAEGSLPASEARGRQTCNADTHPTPTPPTLKEQLDFPNKPIRT